MSRRRVVIALVLGGLILLGAVVAPSGGPVRASGPVLQVTLGANRTPSATPTRTPTDTPTPTNTPSPTLPPPPENGGLVAVDSIFVRVGPSRYWAVLGWLAHGDEVYPIARSTDGNWVVVDYWGTEAWLDARFVTWGEGVDIDALPERPMPSPPPTPTDLPRTVTPTNTSPPTAPPTAIPLIVETTALPVAPTYTPSATIRPMATAPAATPVPGEPPGDGASAPSSFPLGGILAIGGVGVLLLGFYGWRFVHETRNLRRYRDGFPVVWCPACRSAHLHLDERVNRVLGIPRVHRTVRCDGCRSVLREISPGVWRYTVDPAADDAFAADYNGKLLDDDGLIELASRGHEGSSEAEPS